MQVVSNEDGVVHVFKNLATQKWCIIIAKTIDEIQTLRNMKTDTIVKALELVEERERRRAVAVASVQEVAEEEGARPRRHWSKP